MLGPKTAQIALSFGADDIDGTVVEERIVHMAGATSPEELTVTQLRRLIEEAGRTPVERDTLYNRVVREPATAGGTA
jgi:aminodeoxyfutalosine synthase